MIYIQYFIVLTAGSFTSFQALASGPGALFLGSNAAGSSADLAVKVREDPLFLIKKKEQEARKQLVSNPVKMKQLHKVRMIFSLYT